MCLHKLCEKLMKGLIYELITDSAVTENQRITTCSIHVSIHHKLWSNWWKLTPYTTVARIKLFIPDPEMSTPTLFFLLTPGICLQHCIKADCSLSMTTRLLSVKTIMTFLVVFLTVLSADLYYKYVLPKKSTITTSYTKKHVFVWVHLLNSTSGNIW